MPDGGRPANPARIGLSTLPNAITFARLCAVPMAVWMVLHGDFAAAFWLFAAAGASDALDGFLARRIGPTRLGTLLDPAADKALLICMYVTLAVVQVLPDWLAIQVVFRDIMIVGGLIVLWLMGHEVPIRPLLISKVNTLLQIVLVTAALMQAGYALDLGPAVAAMVWLVAASTLASGAAYVWQAARR